MYRLPKSLPVLLVMLACAALAQDKPTAPPKPTPEVQKLVNEGSAAAKKYDWTTALQKYKQARAVAQEAKDGIGEASVLGNIGLVYLDIGQPQRALEYFEQALPLFKQISNKKGEAML